MGYWADQNRGADKKSGLYRGSSGREPPILTVWQSIRVITEAEWQINVGKTTDQQIEFCQTVGSNPGKGDYGGFPYFHEGIHSGHILESQPRCPSLKLVRPEFP